MTAERKPTPADFPVLMTPRERQKIRYWPPRTYHTCRVCKLSVPPRNSRRHEQACARRKRLAPELWAEWHADMHQLPVRCCRCSTQVPRADASWDDDGNVYCTDAVRCAERQARAYQREQARRRGHTS